MPKKKTYLDILIWLYYSAIFLILTYPLIKNFNNGIVAGFTNDGPIFIWNAWHLGQNSISLWTNQIFYPNTSPLGLHTYTQFQSLIILLLNYIFHNLVLSFNIAFMLSSAAGGYFAYKFINLLIKNKPIAILAGHFFAFQPIWSIYAIFGTQNFLGLWYIPATLFCYEKFRRTNKIHYSFTVGAMLALAFINGLYPFVFSITGLIIYSLVVNFTSLTKNLNHYLKLIYSIFISFSVLAGWKIYLMWQQREFIGSLPRPALENIDQLYHADPMNLIRPVQFHPLWGQWHTWFKNTSIENGNSFLGFTFITVLLIFLILKISTKNKFTDTKYLLAFLVAYIITLSLSFGPYLHIFGYETGLAMPHYFLQKIISAINNLRFPARWLLLAQIFLSGIFALLLKYIWQNTHHKLQKILFIITAIGLTIDVAFLPRHITQLYGANTTIYENIKKKDNQKTVLNIPLSVSSGYFDMGTTSKLPMAWQTIHNKPIIGGHLSRLPETYRAYYQEQPVIKYLLNYQNKLPDESDLDKNNIDKWRQLYNVGYIVIDKAHIDSPSTHYQQLLEYLQNELSFFKTYEDKYFIMWE